MIVPSANIEKETFLEKQDFQLTESVNWLVEIDMSSFNIYIIFFLEYFMLLQSE